jgi:hypothetical protein
MTLAKAIAGIRHAARSHARKRAAYPEMLAAFLGLKAIRVRSRRELPALLADLA